MLVARSLLPPTIEHPQSIYRFCGGSEHYTAMNCIVLFLNWVLRGPPLQSVLVYNFTNMHQMFYRSEFFAASFRVNNQEPAVSFTVLLHSALAQVRLPSVLIPTTMSDSKWLNTSLVEVMLSSNDERDFILDLNNLSFELIFDAWWASMDVGLKRPSASNNSRPVPSWRFNLDCRSEVTGSAGIRCIECHQVLRNPSEYGTSSLAETLAGKSSHHKVISPNIVRSYWIE